MRKRSSRYFLACSEIDVKYGRKWDISCGNLLVIALQLKKSNVIWTVPKVLMTFLMMGVKTGTLSGSESSKKCIGCLLLSFTRLCRRTTNCSLNFRAFSVFLATFFMMMPTWMMFSVDGLRSHLRLSCPMSLFLPISLSWSSGKLFEWLRTRRNLVNSFAHMTLSVMNLLLQKVPVQEDKIGD